MKSADEGEAMSQSWQYYSVLDSATAPVIKEEEFTLARRSSSSVGKTGTDSFNVTLEPKSILTGPWFILSSKGVAW